MPAGRPYIPVDEDTILKAAEEGCTLKEIAAYCGVSDDTISRNYADIVKRGRLLMQKSLRRKQVEVAQDGNPTMLIWLGKQYLEQKDKIETAGDPENPNRVVVEFIGQAAPKEEGK